VNARLRELLAERDAGAAGLRAVGATLQAQVADLAAKAGRNSQNSSKPPSSDGPAKPAPKSLRAKSGREPGRPKGQPGATMQLSGLRVPFDNNEAERVIRMSKLRIKASGCMRSMKGAEACRAIRSYLATASRHGIGWLDALTRAAEGTPWIPETG
jgi:hypothetical protein